MNNHIVILGGMGPQASAELQRLIVDKAARTCVDPVEFPEILHASLTIRDFIADTEAIPDAITHTREACQALPMLSASAIGLACNTAHLLLDRIPELQNDRFVSMIDAVCESVVAGRFEKVGLLASPSTIRSKLYESPLRDRGIDIILPSKDDLPELADIIRGLIAGENRDALRMRLNAICDMLARSGADVILLGCTELPLIGIDTSLPTISSLEVLAACLLTKHSEGAML